MRTAFINQLIEEAKRNPNIVLLVGDLGYHVIEPFAQEFPDRFLNVGIAEQNMTGIAAGLAMTGKIVYTYSIGNFPTLRCIEQIRNDVAYHNANVRIVAVGGGYAYGDLGATHHATEAIGMMRSIPNMAVCSPSDPIETKLITGLSVAHKGPMYIQLGKAGEKVIWEDAPLLSMGGILPFIKKGNKQAILVSGSIASTLVEDYKLKDFDIYTLPFIKPFNIEQIKSVAESYEKIFVLEEHQKSCGIGSAVVEVLSDLYANSEIPKFPKIKRIAINDEFCQICGSQQYLRNLNNLFISTKS